MVHLDYIWQEIFKTYGLTFHPLSDNSLSDLSNQIILLPFPRTTHRLDTNMLQHKVQPNNTKTWFIECTWCWTGVLIQVHNMLILLIRNPDYYQSHRAFLSDLDQLLDDISACTTLLT